MSNAPTPPPDAQSKASAKKSRASKKRIQAYAFIDTNIFLDFYRASNEASLTLLEKLNTVRDRIISTYQVEMEFLKNRQTTLLSATKEITYQILGAIPAVATDEKNKNYLDKIKSHAKDKITSIQSKVASIIANPAQNDRVYSVLEGIFQGGAKHVLTRQMTVRQGIKRKALRRFLMGYPPRKDKDTSYGDALNWEWILETSKQLSGKIYIVSRDGDYGCEYNGRYFLNDQLKREFRDRVGNKSIVFTKRLSEALKALEVPVTKEEDAAEEKSLAIDPNAAKYTKEFWEDFTKRTELIEKTLADLAGKWGITPDKADSKEPSNPKPNT